jgi:biotin synthase
MHDLQKIRISIGSAILIGLKQGKMDTNPSTCYIMTFTDRPCAGHCGFCPQGNHTNVALNSEGELITDLTVIEKRRLEQLSRVQWPVFQWSEFINALVAIQNQNIKPKFNRICVQVLNYPQMVEDLYYIIKEIHKKLPNLPFSAAIPPISKEDMKKLKEAGLERIGIALDASTPELFHKIKGKAAKGPYSWDTHWHALNSALDVFGEGFVTTHLIVGMGETVEELIHQLETSIQKKILPGIFLFTPIRGTPMEHIPRPSIHIFRRIQLARYLLLRDLKASDRFIFKEGDIVKIKNLTEMELKKVIDRGDAFKTAGCPACNRPNYTSAPGEEPDGYPRNLTPGEKKHIFNQLSPLIDLNE